MFSNFFKIAVRNLLRNRSYAIINVLGLSVGVASCLVIFLVIRFELSYDRFQSKRDRICRVVSVFDRPDGTRYSDGVPFPIADGLRLDFPQLEEVAAIDAEDDVQVTAKDGSSTQSEKKFKEVRGVYFAEPQIFGILDLKTLAGNPEIALADPTNAVLSRETAERYFGDWKSAIGKTIIYRNREVFTVTAIIDDNPVNSDFHFKVLMSYANLKNRRARMWQDWVSTDRANNCYVLLPPQYAAAQFNSSMDAFVRRHKPAEYVTDRLQVQRLSDMHFESRFDTFSGRTFSRELITALSLVAIFLLITACVNFINLATAQAASRSREVGVRKVLGSDRWQLMMQFLAETAVIAGLAVFVALAVAEVALPYINQLLEISLSRDLFSDFGVIAFLAATYAGVTLLSGSYPAFILSGYSPIAALRSKASARIMGRISLRRALVVLQFIISQVLIVCMLVVVSQMNFFRSASLGFDKDQIVLVPIPNDSLSQAKIDLLRARLLGQSGISGVSFSDFSLSDDSHWTSDFMFDRSNANTDFNADLKWADADYFKTYKLQFVAGRPYVQSDSVREFVVNETLLRKLGIRDPQDILGKRIRFWKGKLSAPIVGVVRDFHGRPLQEPIWPEVLGSWKDTYNLINIKIQPGQPARTLAAIERIWSEAYPAYVYEYQFLDDKIDHFYHEENRLSELYQIFAGIAIFISCLGLYGLVSFMANRRAKEVGIRKVLGASVVNIVFLLSREFTLLIGIAFAIAGPVAYYVMSMWLQDFAFRIQLGVGLFLMTIIGTVVIAWMTVGYRAVKTAIANPVDALRYE